MVAKFAGLQGAAGAKGEGRGSRLDGGQPEVVVVTAASGLGLGELPATLAGMEGLTRLDLTDNCIWRGWERLRSLRQLRELSLNHCLEVVPAVLEGMESLTSLDLGGYQILSGWEHLCPLMRLQVLSPDEYCLEDCFQHCPNLMKCYDPAYWHRP